MTTPRACFMVIGSPSNLWRLGHRQTPVRPHLGYGEVSFRHPPFPSDFLRPATFPPLDLDRDQTTCAGRHRFRSPAPRRTKKNRPLSREGGAGHNKPCPNTIRLHQPLRRWFSLDLTEFNEQRIRHFSSGLRFGDSGEFAHNNSGAPMHAPRRALHTNCLILHGILRLFLNLRSSVLGTQAKS